jgi:hypothetical protein
VLEKVDPAGGRRDTLFQETLPEQRIEKSALPRVKFPYDHQQEQFIQLADGVFQGFPVFNRRREPGSEICKLVNQCRSTATSVSCVSFKILRVTVINHLQGTLLKLLSPSMALSAKKASIPTDEPFSTPARLRGPAPA